MGTEKAVVLEPNQNYVCGNVLLALNKQHAFKIVGNQVEHDEKVIEKLELDKLCEDKEYLNQIMNEPAKYLPYKEMPVQAQVP